MLNLSQSDAFPVEEPQEMDCKKGAAVNRGD